MILESSGRRRAAALLLALVTSTTTLVGVSSAPTATAAPLPPCRAQDMPNGKVYRAVQLRDRTFEVTHAARKRVAAGTTYSNSTTMTKVKQLTASLKIAQKTSAEADIFVGKASAELGFELATVGSATSTKSVTETFAIGESARDRLFVFYSGRADFAFRTARRVCQQGQVTDTYGSLRSHSKVDESGFVLCPHTRYRAGTVKRQVALAGGC